MKKLRVLHILNSKAYSGAENVVVSIITSLKTDYEFAYESPDGPIRETLKDKGIIFYPVKETSPIEIKRVIEAFHPDVIHAHDYTAGIAAVLTFTNIPIINHLHNNSPWLRKIGIKSIVYGICAYRVTKILTVSDSIMDEYVFGGHFKGKTEVVGNPIDINKIRIMAGMRNEDDIEFVRTTQKKYDLVFLGRETPPKNPLRLLRLVCLIKEAFGQGIENNGIENSLGHTLRIVMIGSGEMHDQITQEISRLGLEDNVIRLGFQENPYKYLKEAKVMLMPSSWEGFGLAAVEALALGIPVVASPVGGLKNIITSQCGKLCNTDEEFVFESSKLLTDNNYYIEKSKEAVMRAYYLDNSESYMNKIARIYKECFYYAR